MEFLPLLLLLQEPVPEAPPSPPAWVERFHGSTTLRQRNRWTTRQSDADLMEYLSLSYGDDGDLISASASARFAEDLDGERDVDGFNAFDSLDDSYRRGSTGRLYTAYMDINNPFPGLHLRAGRQTLDDFSEAVPMDGGSASYALGEWAGITAFGGRPVNLFESSPAGDRMYGGAVEASLWSRGRARVDYLHLEDENLFGLFDDDLVGFACEQGAGPLLISGRWTLLERENRDAMGRITGSFPAAGLIVDARFDYVFERRYALSYAIDPYAVFLFDLEPYAQYSLRASQTLGERFSIDASYTSREFVRDGEEGDYNHEFTRWNVTPRALEWPLPDLSLAIPVDFWRSTGDDFWTVGGDLEVKAHRVFTLGMGTGYALYTIDAFTGEERERIRTFYGTIRWKLQQDMTLNVRYIVERNDFDTYRTLEVGARHAF